MKKIIFISIAFLLAVSVKAQVSTADSLHFYRSIGFKFDNDIFFQTDYYYTSGENIFFLHPSISKSPIAKLFITKFDKHDVEYNGISIEHQMYTPTDTPSDTVKVGDRPYAASLTLNQFQIFENKEKGYRVTSTLSMGVIGKSALGAEIQSLIHEITPSQQPVGWESQIRNDILLNYNFRIDKRLYQSNHFELLASSNVTIGTVNTDISASANMRFGWMDSFFNSYSPIRNSGFKTWMELGYDAKLVGYNAYLQGGVFNRTSPYVKEASEIKRLIHTFDAKIFVQYNKHRLIFEAYRLSPEFDESMWHAWGRISYQYWF